MMYRTAESQSLKVRTRRVLHENGMTTVASSVFCPRQDKAMGLGHCKSCERYDGLTSLPDGQGHLLWCRHGTAAHEPSETRTANKQSPGTRTPVSEIMAANVVCVRGDVTVETVTTLMLARGFSGLPVVNATGSPIGVVSKTDILRDWHENGDVEEHVLDEAGELDYEILQGFHAARIARTMVADIMTPIAFTVQETVPISQAAALMAFEGIHRVPVVGTDGTVVGVLSSLDVLRWLAKSDGYLVPEPSEREPVVPTHVAGFALAELMAQHEELRALMNYCEAAAAEEVEQGGLYEGQPITRWASRLMEAFVAHAAFEEEQLRMYLLESFGEARTNEIVANHRAEHEAAFATLHDIASMSDPLAAAEALRRAVARIRLHMQLEERDFLNEHILRDDLISIDAFGG